MKRFLLFVGMRNKPEGGMNDFHGDYDTAKEADEAGMVSTDGESSYTSASMWYHVYDTEKREIVEQWPL